MDETNKLCVCVSVYVSVYMRVYVHIIFIREISVCTYVYRDEKKKGGKKLERELLSSHSICTLRGESTCSSVRLCVYSSLRHRANRSRCAKTRERDKRRTEKRVEEKKTFELAHLDNGGISEWSLLFVFTIE